MNAVTCDFRLGCSPEEAVEPPKEPWDHGTAKHGLQLSGFHLHDVGELGRFPSPEVAPGRHPVVAKGSGLGHSTGRQQSRHWGLQGMKFIVGVHKLIVHSYPQ